MKIARKEKIGKLSLKKFDSVVQEVLNDATNSIKDDTSLERKNTSKTIVNELLRKGVIANKSDISDSAVQALCERAKMAAHSNVSPRQELQKFVELISDENLFCKISIQKSNWIYFGYFIYRYAVASCT